MGDGSLGATAERRGKEDKMEQFYLNKTLETVVEAALISDGEDFGSYLVVMPRLPLSPSLSRPF